MTAFPSHTSLKELTAVRVAISKLSMRVEASNFVQFAFGKMTAKTITMLAKFAVAERHAEPGTGAHELSNVQGM